jgi:hypothetical protein
MIVMIDTVGACFSAPQILDVPTALVQALLKAQPRQFVLLSGCERIGIQLNRRNT